MSKQNEEKKILIVKTRKDVGWGEREPIASELTIYSIVSPGVNNVRGGEASKKSSIHLPFPFDASPPLFFLPTFTRSPILGTLNYRVNRTQLIKRFVTFFFLNHR